MSESEIWEKLSKIDCSGYIEKKGKFNYLSWAWAWGELKKVYPLSTYTIKKDVNGLPYFKDDGGFICFVEVTVLGLTHEMWLPVMDYNNKALTNPSMMDVNKTIMRCLVKCLAMFGLGHYIYAGEDLPEQSLVSDDVREYEAILDSGDSMKYFVFVSNLSEDKHIALNGSHPKGKISHYKTKAKELSSASAIAIDGFSVDAASHLENGDKQALEELFDCDKAIRSAIWSRLSESQKSGIAELMQK